MKQNTDQTPGMREYFSTTGSMILDEYVIERMHDGGPSVFFDGVQALLDDYWRGDLRHDLVIELERAVIGGRPIVALFETKFAIEELPEDMTGELVSGADLAPDGSLDDAAKLMGLQEMLLDAQNCPRFARSAQEDAAGCLRGVPVHDDFVD